MRMAASTASAGYPSELRAYMDLLASLDAWGSSVMHAPRGAPVASNIQAAADQRSSLRRGALNMPRPAPPTVCSAVEEQGLAISVAGGGSLLQKFKAES